MNYTTNVRCSYHFNVATSLGSPPKCAKDAVIICFLESASQLDPSSHYFRIIFSFLLEVDVWLAQWNERNSTECHAKLYVVYLKKNIY